VSTIGHAFVVSSALIFGATVLGISAGYRMNVTASLPIGVYRVSPVHRQLRRGDLVTFTLPASLRLHRFLRSFTKPVAGLPGDQVCVEDSQLLINGEDYGPVLPDAPAHALEDGVCVTVGEGYVFTASTYPRSYDSRYYSAIPLASVQRSTPVLTWMGGSVIDIPRPACPQCDQREDIRRTCRHCSYEYPLRGSNVVTSLLRLTLAILVGTYVVILFFMAAVTGLKYLVFPLLSLSFRV